MKIFISSLLENFVDHCSIHIGVTLQTPYLIQNFISCYLDYYLKKIQGWIPIVTIDLMLTDHNFDGVYLESKGKNALKFAVNLLTTYAKIHYALMQANAND